MLSYNEIKEKKVIIMDDEPYEVISSHVFRKQQRKPVNATKLRNLISGKVTECSFHVSDKVDEADLVRKDIVFLYENKGEYWFHPEGDKSGRFALDLATVGEQTAKFLKANSPALLMVFEYNGEERNIGVTLPKKQTYKVKEAPPTIKGNTATGGNKVITLENGTNINAPLFIEAGEEIVVNTETGEYVERAK